MMRSMRAISPPLPYKFDTEVVPFLFFLKCRTAAAFAAAVLSLSKKHNGSWELFQV